MATTAKQYSYSSASAWIYGDNISASHSGNNITITGTIYMYSGGSSEGSAEKYVCCVVNGNTYYNCGYWSGSISSGTNYTPWMNFAVTAGVGTTAAGTATIGFYISNSNNSLSSTGQLIWNGRTNTNTSDCSLKVTSVGYAASSGGTVTRTNCTAPTSVTVNKAYALESDTVTISWSGAKAGTNNPIANFTLFCNGAMVGYYQNPVNSSHASEKYARLSNNNGSGSVTIKLNSSFTDNGTQHYLDQSKTSYKWTIRTNGTYQSQPVSSASATTKVYTNVTAPTSVWTTATTTTTSQNNYYAEGSTCRLRWGGAASGTNNAIQSYTIIQGSTTLQTGVTGSYYDVPVPAAGSTYTYKVKAIGAREDEVTSSSVKVYGVSMTASAAPSMNIYHLRNKGSGTTPITLTWSASTLTTASTTNLTRYYVPQYRYWNPNTGNYGSWTNLIGVDEKQTATSYTWNITQDEFNDTIRNRRIFFRVRQFLYSNGRSIVSEVQTASTTTYARQVQPPNPTQSIKIQNMVLESIGDTFASDGTNYSGPDKDNLSPNTTVTRNVATSGHIKAVTIDPSIMILSGYFLVDITFGASKTISDGREVSLSFYLEDATSPFKTISITPGSGDLGSQIVSFSNLTMAYSGATIKVRGTTHNLISDVCKADGTTYTRKESYDGTTDIGETGINFTFMKYFKLSAPTTTFATQQLEYSVNGNGKSPGVKYFDIDNISFTAPYSNSSYNNNGFLLQFQEDGSYSGVYNGVTTGDPSNVFDIGIGTGDNYVSLAHFTNKPGLNDSWSAWQNQNYYYFYPDFDNNTTTITNQTKFTLRLNLHNYRLYRNTILKAVSSDTPSEIGVFTCNFRLVGKNKFGFNSPENLEFTIKINTKEKPQPIEAPQLLSGSTPPLLLNQHLPQEFTDGATVDFTPLRRTSMNELCFTFKPFYDPNNVKMYGGSNNKTLQGTTDPILHQGGAYYLRRYKRKLNGWIDEGRVAQLTTNTNMIGIEVIENSVARLDHYVCHIPISTPTDVNTTDTLVLYFLQAVSGQSTYNLITYSNDGLYSSGAITRTFTDDNDQSVNNCLFYLCRLTQPVAQIITAERDKEHRNGLKMTVDLLDTGLTQKYNDVISSASDFRAIDTSESLFWEIYQKLSTDSSYDSSNPLIVDSSITINTSEESYSYNSSDPSGYTLEEKKSYDFQVKTRLDYYCYGFDSSNYQYFASSANYVTTNDYFLSNVFPTLSLRKNQAGVNENTLYTEAAFVVQGKQELLHTTWPVEDSGSSSALVDYYPHTIEIIGDEYNRMPDYVGSAWDYSSSTLPVSRGAYAGFYTYTSGERDWLGGIGFDEDHNAYLVTGIAGSRVKSQILTAATGLYLITSDTINNFSQGSSATYQIERTGEYINVFKNNTWIDPSTEAGRQDIIKGLCDSLNSYTSTMIYWTGNQYSSESGAYTTGHGYRFGNFGACMPYLYGVLKITKWTNNIAMEYYEYSSGSNEACSNIWYGYYTTAQNTGWLGWRPMGPSLTLEATTAIDTNANLDDISSPGSYYATSTVAKTCSNLPTYSLDNDNAAFRLNVYKAYGGATGNRIQELTYITGLSFRRSINVNGTIVYDWTSINGRSNIIGPMNTSGVANFGNVFDTTVVTSVGSPNSSLYKVGSTVCLTIHVTLDNGISGTSTPYTQQISNTNGVPAGFRPKQGTHFPAAYCSSGTNVRVYVTGAGNVYVYTNSAITAGSTLTATCTYPAWQ